MKCMKVTLLSALMATTSGALAENGVLEFKGAITATSCSIPSSQLTRGFDVGIIETAQLAAAGPGESLRAHDLNFSVTNCPAATQKVTLRFVYDTDSGAGNGYIRNAGTAEGMRLGLTNSRGDRVYNQGKIESADLDASAGTATLSAKVQAYRIGSDAPVAGNIDSSVNLYLESE